MLSNISLSQGWVLGGETAAAAALKSSSDSFVPVRYDSLLFSFLAAKSFRPEFLLLKVHLDGIVHHRIEYVQAEMRRNLN